MGCTGITSVVIPNSVTYIAEEAFDYCTSLISVTIPNSVTYIGKRAFGECHGLTSVTIPNSVTSIGDSAFYLCLSLTSVTIPNSVATIGESAFRKCWGLTSVTIPNSVTAIGNDAFHECSDLQTIYVQNQVPVECSPYFPDNVINNTILYIPTGTLSAYKKVDPWRNFQNIVEMDFSGIEDADMDAGKGTDEPLVRVENGVINIDNTDGDAITEVFDISGKTVFRKCANTVSELAKGTYIVKVGNKVQKIRL